MSNKHDAHEKEVKKEDKIHHDHKIKHQSADAVEQHQWKKHPGGG